MMVGQVKCREGCSGLVLGLV